jgi:adenosine/AMP kinase
MANEVEIIRAVTEQGRAIRGVVDDRFCGRSATNFDGL